MNRISKGLLAGAGATVPMSITMGALHKIFPEEEKREEPLPPRKITANLLHKLGLFPDELDEGTLSLLNHFSYGAAAGAAYNLLTSRVPAVRTSWGGMGFGAAVWALSYFGIMPAIGLHKPATKEHSERNSLMLLAHLVWGASLYGLLEQMEQESRARPSLRSV